MRLVTSGALRQIIEQTLRDWTPWYLAEAERWEAAEGLDALTVDRPREWRMAVTQSTPDARQLPLVVVSVGSWEAERHPDTIDGVYQIAVNVLLRGTSWEDTSRRCGVYGAAYAAVIAQQLRAHDWIADAAIREVGYDVRPESTQRTLGEVVIAAAIAVRDVMPTIRELTTPPADPSAAYVGPTADTVTVHVDPLES